MRTITLKIILPDGAHVATNQSGRRVKKRIYKTENNRAFTLRNLAAYRNGATSAQIRKNYAADGRKPINAAAMLSYLKKDGMARYDGEKYYITRRGIRQNSGAK